MANQFNKEFAKRARKRAPSVKLDFNQIVGKADGNAVHDFRKETRHLQAIIDACAIRQPSRKLKKIKQRLQKSRHALSEWRDGDVLLAEVRKARRRASTRDQRQSWVKVSTKIAKRRRNAQKKFFKKYKSLRVKATAAQAGSTVKKKARKESLVDNLRLLLQRSWEKWNDAIDRIVDRAGAPELHEVRIKTKGLRYAIDLSQKFYPDSQLTKADRWLKDIQDRVGEWHDELLLGQSALETFSKTPRKPGAIDILRDVKEREIELAESARNYLVQVRKTKEYQRLKRVLAASLYAMAEPAEATASDRITGPIR